MKRQGPISYTAPLGSGQPNYFHHGQFTTLRQAILNHFGEASPTLTGFVGLGAYDQESIIEFLKTFTAPQQLRTGQ